MLQLFKDMSGIRSESAVIRNLRGVSVPMGKLDFWRYFQASIEACTVGATLAGVDERKMLVIR